MEERAAGREKAETSEAPVELGVEVSAPSHQGSLGLPTQARPLSLRVCLSSFYCPGEKLQGLPL